MSSLLTFGIFQQINNSTPTWDANTGGFFRGLEYYPVTSSTGKVWLDRNLGATQVATSLTDSAAYGYLFQWGRYWDDHESRTSSTTTTNATTAVPNNGNSWDGLFILETLSPYDWLTPQNNNLWQGVNGTNNPCPPGYRLPTYTEWNAEMSTFSPNNVNGGYASVLKLPAGGARDRRDGVLGDVGSRGYYWGSTVSGIESAYIRLRDTDVEVDYQRRAGGYSVRCICDAC